MEVKTLDNGLKIYYIPVNTKTIGVGIVVKIGSVYEEKDKRGISHLLEHMMFKSNKRYSSKEINEGLELNGGIANAYTDTFLTSYVVETIPEGFEKVIDILFSMFENDKYDKKEFENEKRVVLSELERYENDPETRLRDLIPKSVFGDSDYGDPVGGYRETVESIEKEDLEEFKEKYYSPNNMFIILLGKFNEKHKEILENYFSRLEEKEVKKKKPSKDNGKDIEIFMNTRNQIYYSLNFKIPLDKRFFLFENIVSGGLSSITFQTIREKYGIGYRVSFDISYLYEDSMIYSLSIPGFEKEKEDILENAVNELFENIKSMDENYFQGRLRRFKLKYEKKRINLFERLFIEPYLISLFNQTYDSFFKDIIKYKLEDIKDLIDLLKYGRKIVIRNKG